jgi:hypothetical protein
VQARQAAAEIRESEGEARGWVLMWITVAQARAGDEEGFLRSEAGLGQWAYFRFYASLGIAEALLEAGDRPRTVTRLRRAFDLMVRTEEQTFDSQFEGLFFLATLQAMAGDEDALLQSPFFRDEEAGDPMLLYCAIAYGQARAGRADAALRTIGQLLEKEKANLFQPMLPIDTLIAIATAQRQAGDARAARQTLDRAAEIAARVAREEAQGSQGFTPGPGGRIIRESDVCRDAIAEALVEAGDADAARKLAGSAAEDTSRAEILRMVAQTQARGGETAAALRWAGELPSKVQKASALLGVAEGIVGQLYPHGRYGRSQRLPDSFAALMRRPRF